LTVRRSHHLIGLAFEELSHQVYDLWVIVDHQEAAALRRDMCQGRQDGLPVKRFEQIVEGPELIPQGFVVHNREHNDRNISGNSVCLQLVQELPAVLVRHEDVKRDGQWAEGPRLLQSFLTTRGPDHTIARLGEVLAQEIDDIRIVVDGQDDLVRLWRAEALLTKG